MQQKVAVLGAGSWGTSLALVLADNRFAVSLWSHNEDHVLEMHKLRRNRKYLPNVILPDHIHPTHRLHEAVDGAAAVLFVIPANAVRDVARQVSHVLQPHQLVIHAAKGFELHSLKRMSQVLEEELPVQREGKIVALSGPSHAEEVAHRTPTTVVVSAEESGQAKQAQDLLANAFFRVYTNPDIVGVEIGGALKNIIALGAGLSDGLGFGDNAKAALLTRGLAEIVRLGVKMGADAATFSGLAGIGDLVVTCTSKHSRNWRAGHAIGQGYSINDVLHRMGMVVEGIKTTQAAHELSERYRVEMPITQELYHVLFEEKAPRLAVEDLMGRGKTQEWEDIAREIEEI